MLSASRLLGDISSLAARQTSDRGLTWVVYQASKNIMAAAIASKKSEKKIIFSSCIHEKIVAN